MIPLTVVGGFLGAGKTTLLNHLLRDTGGRRLAVLVNDFGAIGIDAELVASRDGDTISLTNGCVCCGMSGELIFALAGLRDRDDPPDHVVVEASGIGDPAAIAAYGELPGYARDAAIVVVDAETVRDRAGDDRLGPGVAAQLRSADLVVLNKADLVSADELAATRVWLRDGFPSAAIVEATFGDVPAAVLLGARDGSSGAVPAPGPGHHHAQDFATWSWSGAAALHGEALAAFLRTLPDGVLRVKGFVHLREDPAHRYLLQLVGRRGAIARDRPWGDQAPGSRLVLIGVPEAIRPDELTAAMRRLTGAT